MRPLPRRLSCTRRSTSSTSAGASSLRTPGTRITSSSITTASHCMDHQRTLALGQRATVLLQLAIDAAQQVGGADRVLIAARGEDRSERGVLDLGAGQLDRTGQRLDRAIE